jgi:hypothetical protein
MDLPVVDHKCSYANDHGAARGARHCVATCDEIAGGAGAGAGAGAGSGPDASALLGACRTTCVNVYLDNIVSAQQVENACLNVQGCQPRACHAQPR